MKYFSEKFLEKFGVQIMQEDHNYPIKWGYYVMKILHAIIWWENILSRQFE